MCEVKLGGRALFYKLARSQWYQMLIESTNPIWLALCIWSYFVFNSIKPDYAAI